jgi:nitroreductase
MRDSPFAMLRYLRDRLKNCAWRVIMIDILRTRRSIRKFQDKPLDSALTGLLKEALLRCPSSRGINPWIFIFVDDADLIGELSRAREHGSAFLSGAPLAIVVCGDETKSDVWVEDCSIASVVAHLTAHSLGLGSCWIQIRNRDHAAGRSAEDFVQALLGIPKHLRVEAMVAVGYPGEQKSPVPAEKLDYGRIKHNRYL